jgi:ABC-type transporter Mla subunit MlaD
VSGGQIAALIAAVAFVLLVGLLAVPLLKLGRTLDEATLAIRKAHDGAGPILINAQTTVERVNSQLERVDGITANAQSVTSNTAALTSLFASTLGGPVVKIAAFSYGIRRAAGNRRKAELDKGVKAARRAERRTRRAAKKGAA